MADSALYYNREPDFGEHQEDGGPSQGQSNNNYFNLDINNDAANIDVDVRNEAAISGDF